MDIAEALTVSFADEIVTATIDGVEHYALWQRGADLPRTCFYPVPVFARCISKLYGSTGRNAARKLISNKYCRVVEVSKAKANLPKSATAKPGTINGKRKKRGQYSTPTATVSFRVPLTSIKLVRKHSKALAQKLIYWAKQLEKQETERVTRHFAD